MCIAIDYDYEEAGSKMDGLVKDEILAMDKPDCCGECEEIWDDVKEEKVLQLEESKAILMPADWEIGMSKISAEKEASLLLVR